VSTKRFVLALPDLLFLRGLFAAPSTGPSPSVNAENASVDGDGGDSSDPAPAINRSSCAPRLLVGLVGDFGPRDFFGDRLIWPIFKYYYYEMKYKHINRSALLTLKCELFNGIHCSPT
jgi:hypothetical protein